MEQWPASSNSAYLSNIIIIMMEQVQKHLNIHLFIDKSFTKIEKEGGEGKASSLRIEPTMNI